MRWQNIGFSVKINEFAAVEENLAQVAHGLCSRTNRVHAFTRFPAPCPRHVRLPIRNPFDNGILPKRWTALIALFKRVPTQNLEGLDESVPVV